MFGVEGREDVELCSCDGDDGGDSDAPKGSDGGNGECDGEDEGDDFPLSSVVVLVSTIVTTTTNSNNHNTINVLFRLNKCILECYCCIAFNVLPRAPRMFMGTSAHITR